MEEKHFSIEQIPPAATLTVRQAELYPKLLLKKLQLENDEHGIHFGLFYQNRLISVVSCIEKKDRSMQFRKFATLKEFQNQGFGSALLNYIFNLANQQSISTIWCNAQVSAISFYNKFGMIETKKRFHKEGIDFVIMEKKIL